MTVEDLIEELKAMPPTATVFVLVPLVERTDWYELVDVAIEATVYDLGSVSIRLQE